MRLMSGLYRGFHPFDSWGLWEDYDVAHDPDDLRTGDTLIIHGGSDISPSLYGKKVSKQTWASENPSQRDIAEMSLIQRATELGCPIIGICRGGQLLCAAAGGYLIQHLDNHGGVNHPVVTNDGKQFYVNTIHHQMMMPGNTKHELIAWTPERLSKRYFDEDTMVEVPKENEFIFFNDIKGFAIQWHPEGMSEKSAANIYLERFVKDRM